MSDPMNNRPDVPPPEPERKSSSPLVWILVLIALIAFAWYFYNRNAGTGSAGDLTPPPATSDAMTPAPSSSAENEGTATRRNGNAAAPKRTAPATPANRTAALLNPPKPTYPPDAYRAGEEGTVTVRAQVDELGNASDVTIIKRSGSRVLDRAAMNEVRKWKFRPAIRNGKTVSSSIQVPVDYRLEER